MTAEGVSFRPAMAGDYAAFVVLHAELGIDDPVPGEALWVAELAPRTIIAEIGGVAVGYAYFQMLKGVGYLRQIVVAPAVRGRAVGRAIMEHLAGRLRAGGATRWCLNVKPNNVRAIRLYERMGLRAAYASAALRFEWTLVDRLPVVPDVTAATIAAADDAEVEARFDIAGGLLAETRTRGRTLVRIDEGGALAGAAVFAPRFPGAFPFRVARPELAGPLLRALQPHALVPNMQVVCEDDPSLVAALVAAGARVHVEIVHFRGEL